MKPEHQKLFEIIKTKLLNLNNQVSVHFIERRFNSLISIELRIVYGRAYAFLNDSLIEKFNKLDFELIKNNIDSRYREGWENSYKDVKVAISGDKLVRLNPLCAGFFGPFFNPNKRTQSFNVYQALFFKISEIEKLNINRNKLERIERIRILSDEYISINDLSNITIETLTNKEKSESTNHNTESTRENEAGNKKGTEDEHKVPTKGTSNDNKSKSEFEPDDKDIESLKLKNIKIHNLTNFNPIDVTFSSGVNVIIGENSSGKTTLIKFLYASLKALENYNRQKLNLDFGTIDENLSDKLYNVFKEPSRGISTLLARKSIGNQFEASITLGDEYLEADMKFNIGEQTIRRLKDVELSPLLDYVENESIVDLYNTLFIPSKEILSLYKAIKFNTNQKRIDFDDTYFDLTNCIELTAEEPEEMQVIVENLDSIIMGKIEFRSQENKFVFISDNEIYEMPMTAEGVKQIGVLSTLLKNREIKRNTILFLDEPDTNLNPRAIRPYVKMLVELAKLDVQIFITTHNDFVLTQFEICAKVFKNTPISCFSLYTNEKNKKIEIEKVFLRNGLPLHNKIHDEAMDMYDETIKAEFR